MPNPGGPHIQHATNRATGQSTESGLGGVGAFFTSGGDEPLAQAAAAQRLAAAGARIRVIIDGFVAKVAAVAGRITSAAANLAPKLTQMARLLGVRVRLFAAEVQGVVPRFAEAEELAAEESAPAFQALSLVNRRWHKMPAAL